MRIAFTGTLAETISALKAVRAMAYESDGTFGVACDTIIMTEGKIYSDINKVISNCSEDIFRAILTTEIELFNGRSRFRCYAYGCDKPETINFSIGEIIDTEEED